jgi:hypothetical protein
MKLNDLERAKKLTIYDKYRGSVKGKNRKEIKKLWTSYRKEIQREITLPKYRHKIAGKTPLQKEKLREKYFLHKEKYIRKEEFVGIKDVKTFKQKYSTNKYYQIPLNANLNEAVKTIFKKYSNARYVLVILKIRLTTGEVMRVSDVFNKIRIERLGDKNIYDLVLEKLSFVHAYEGFKLLGIYIRIIYANVK